MKFKTFVALFFIILIIIFSLQNTELTEIKFVFWKFSISRVLVILGSFAIGIFVGLLISMKKIFKKIA